MEVRKELCGILAENTGRTTKDIYRKTRTDTFFNAQEAVDFGLADQIIQKI